MVKVDGRSSNGGLGRMVDDEVITRLVWGKRRGVVVVRVGGGGGGVVLGWAEVISGREGKGGGESEGVLLHHF